MAAPWERLFIRVARTLGWVVVLTPLGIVGVVCAAAVAGHQRSDAALFFGYLGAQLATTLAIAIIAAALGASTGIGTAIVTRELGAGRPAHLIGGFAFGLTLFPATVLGWFTATVILPAFPSRSGVAVLVAACIAVTLTVIARSNRLADQTLARVPQALREAAAAAGADARRLSAHVLLPSCRLQLVAIYFDALSRAIGEAAAVSIVFLAAARAGYAIVPFSIPAALVAHAQTFPLIDAGMAQSALLLVALGVAAKIASTRRMHDRTWAS